MTRRLSADTATVLVGRRYVVALCVAILAIVAYAAVPRHKTAQPQASSGHLHAMEVAALNRLRLPHNFTRLTKGCAIGRCYLANAPVAAVQTMMPTLLRTAGFKPPGSLLAAEPISKLKADGWTTHSSDPLVMACKHISTSSISPIEKCQDAGRVGPTLVNVLVRSAKPCHKGACLALTKAEVITWSAALPGVK
jgi:hypothetical protein